VPRTKADPVRSVQVVRRRSLTLSLLLLCPFFVFVEPAFELNRGEQLRQELDKSFMHEIPRKGMNSYRRALSHVHYLVDIVIRRQNCDDVAWNQSPRRYTLQMNQVWCRPTPAPINGFQLLPRELPYKPPGLMVVNGRHKARRRGDGKHRDKIGSVYE